MFNRKQKDLLANLAFKTVEILMAGVIVAGLMNGKVKEHIGMVVLGFALMPIAIFIGLVLASDDDKPP